MESLYPTNDLYLYEYEYFYYSVCSTFELNREATLEVNFAKIISVYSRAIT